MPSYFPYSPSETYRIANSYRTRVKKLVSKKIILETQSEVLEWQITEQQALCAVLEYVDQERYAILVRSLKTLRELEKGVKEELRIVRLQIDRQREILKRRIVMVEEKKGVFPLSNISKRAEFNKKK